MHSVEDYRRWAGDLRRMAVRGGPLGEKAIALAVEYEVAAFAIEAREIIDKAD